VRPGGPVIGNQLPVKQWEALLASFFYIVDRVHPSTVRQAHGRQAKGKEIGDK
jgi:hypothetical protein